MNLFGVNVTDPMFGGPPTDENWAPMFNSAIQYLINNMPDTRGGVIFIPKGYYLLKGDVIINTTMLGDEYLPSITMQGEGMHSTILDFNNNVGAVGPAGGGIFVGEPKTGSEAHPGTFVKLRDFFVRSSGGNNITIREGSNHLELTNIRTSRAAQNGIFFENCFLTTMRDVFASHNAENGFFFNGYHTSIQASGCYASSNGADGWVVNDMTYSSFNSCGADGNSKGWRFSNLKGVKLTGCGAEINAHTGFYVDGDGGPGSYFSGVDNLSLESCFCAQNDSGLQFANFLYLKSIGGNDVSVVIKNCSDLNAPGAYSVAVNGSKAHLINDNNKFVKPVAAVSGGVTTRVQYSREFGPIAVTGANTTIIQLRDIYGATTTFGGTLTIEARSKNSGDATANTATYLLLVSKIVEYDPDIIEIARLGLTQGTANTWPSFIFSLDAGGQLKASPVGSTSGDFHFLITASGNLSLADD